MDLLEEREEAALECANKHIQSLAAIQGDYPVDPIGKQKCFYGDETFKAIKITRLLYDDGADFGDDQILVGFTALIKSPTEKAKMDFYFDSPAFNE